MPGYNTHRLFNYVAFTIIAAFPDTGDNILPFSDLPEHGIVLIQEI
jgi:hypothetical protein